MSMGFSNTNQCQNYYYLETPLLPGALGYNAFSHPWLFQVNCIFSPPPEGFPHRPEEAMLFVMLKASLYFNIFLFLRA